MRYTILFSLLAALFAGVAHAEPTKLTIGIPPANGYLPVLIARDAGDFARNDIEPTVTTILLLPNVPAAILSGSIQIGATNGPVFLQAQENGIDLVAIAGSARYTARSQTMSLVAAAGTTITDAQGLVGKRVAVPGLNSLADLTFRRWLVMHGVQPSSLTEIESALPPMLDLLRSHQVDAAMINEPIRAAVLDSGIATRVADPPAEVQPDLLEGFYMASRPWALAHPREIAGFRAALQSGVDRFNAAASPNDLIEHYQKVRVQVLPTFSPKMSAADLQFEQQLAKQFGLVEGTADPAALILP